MAHKAAFFLVTTLSIHCQPFIEWAAVAQELAILVLNADPDKHPDE